MSLIMHNIGVCVNQFGHSKSANRPIAIGRHPQGKEKRDSGLFKQSFVPHPMQTHRFVLKNQLLRLLPPSPPARLDMMGIDGPPFIMPPPFVPSRVVDAPPPPRRGFAILAPAVIRLLKLPGPTAPPAAIFLDETLAASRRSLTAASCVSNLMKNG